MRKRLPQSPQTPSDTYAAKARSPQTTSRSGTEESPRLASARLLAWGAIGWIPGAARATSPRMTSVGTRKLRPAPIPRPAKRLPISDPANSPQLYPACRIPSAGLSNRRSISMPRTFMETSTRLMKNPVPKKAATSIQGLTASAAEHRNARKTAVPPMRTAFTGTRRFSRSGSPGEPSEETLREDLMRTSRAAQMRRTKKAAPKRAGMHRRTAPPRAPARTASAPGRPSAGSFPPRQSFQTSSAISRTSRTLAHC